MSYDETNQVRNHSTSQLITWYAWNTISTPKEALFCVTALGASTVSLEHATRCYREVDKLVADDSAHAPDRLPEEVATLLHTALMIHRHGRALLGLKTILALAG